MLTVILIALIQYSPKIMGIKSVEYGLVVMELIRVEKIIATSDSVIVIIIFTMIAS